ncbi:MAG: muconate lactonizing mandelate racemase protein [Candidatus Aminicenantes bacterium]|nr:muconate lactonizing mandelate racemase protein [Candidatus Aminicenantes bacterium]
MTISRKDFLKMVGAGALGASLPAGKGLASPKMETARAEAKRLKIQDVEIYNFDIPLTEPFTITLGTITTSNGVLIRITTDAGIIGIGESSPFQPVTGDTPETNIAAARAIREILKGKDPLAIESAHTLFGGFLHSNPALIAAFDMALYDILGKAAGLPIFRLLGGDKNTFETDVTTGIDTPENMVKSVKTRLAAGFKTFKIKVGMDPAADVARIQAIRDAIGYDHGIRIDANQGWTPDQAVIALKAMEKFNIQFCEQPGPDFDIAGMKQVRDESPIGIMADESLHFPTDAIKLINAAACDYFNIKLMKAGGITNGLRIALIAEAANIRCMLGCMIETRLGLTAAAHVHGATRNIIYADLDGYFSHTFDPIIDGMAVKDGMITLPEKPGLGTDIDPAFLKKLKKA